MTPTTNKQSNFKQSTIKRHRYKNKISAAKKKSTALKTNKSKQQRTSNRTKKKAYRIQSERQLPPITSHNMHPLYVKLS